MSSIDQLLESTGAAIHDELAAHRVPPSAAVKARHRRRARRRLGSAAVGVTLLVGVAALGYLNRQDSLVQVSDQRDEQGQQTTPALAEPDPTRTLLAQLIGRDMPRYVRLWTRTETSDGGSVLLSEQWYEPDGTAFATLALISDRAQDLSESDQDVAAWQDLNHIPTLTDTHREEGGDRNFGYPERDLPSDTDALAAFLADPNSSGVKSPRPFATTSSLGGVDRSYLPRQVTTVRQLVLLLPTIMEPQYRQAAYEILLGLDGAEVQEQVVDLLGRPSTIVTIPLPITEPTDGAELGQLRASFWIDPSTQAPHQIEWRLVDGMLGDYSGLSLYVDTTVIIAAGEVATIPDPAVEPRESTSATSTTIEPNSGGNLDEPVFWGDDWAFTVGEAANGDSGTFKVCHNFVPTDEPPTMANGLGTSGCSDWPSSTQPDAVIVDAVPAIRTADSVVVFVDLGTVPVETVVALLHYAGRLEVTPFVMPRSRKQFVVIELPGEFEGVTLQAIGPDGAVLDTRELADGA